MKYFAFLLFWGGFHQTFAQELSFQIKVSADTVVFGSPVNITFNLENTGETLNFVPPDWNTAKFDVVSSGQSTSMVMTNGQYQVSAAYQYVVIPRDTGLLTIPAGTVKGKDSEMKTDSVIIFVTGTPNGHIQWRPSEKVEDQAQPQPTQDKKKKKIKTIRI